jgi:ribosomal protein S18 acetylase RimI-like enzyme
MTIRRATLSDRRAVERVVRDAYSVYVPRIGREPGPMRADYAELIDAGEVWVAAEGADVVGVLVLRADPGSLLLENVAVAPAAQGRGVGRALLAFAEDEARAHGLPEIRLYTHELMTENQRLYRSLGYEETGRRTDEGFARVYFRKPVP